MIMRKVYFDHSATTPTAPEVASLMVEYMTTHYGNPSSVHSFGRETKKALIKARAQVADLIGANPLEILFTSGGTEADNIAIRGVAKANKKRGNHIITTQIEHHAVLHACEALEKEGFRVTYVPVDEYARVNPKDIEDAICDDTILISVMFANNEVGTLQPIKEIGKIAKEHGIYFHTDAVQAVGNYPIDVNEYGIDLLTMSAHKFHGPKGVGALYIRKGVKIRPISFGGAQERTLRPGTENIPGIIGLGKAAEIAKAELEGKMAHLQRLRDRLITGIQERIDEAKLNGHPTERMPGNVNFSFRYIEGEALLLNLDLRGIAGSSGSACTSGSLDPSHVLLAMGMTHEIAHGSLRLSLGRDNTDEDVDYCLEVLPEIVARLRSMSPLYNGNKEA